VIECAKALSFVAFLNHGRLEVDMIAGDDLEVDAGSTGAVMMVVGSRDAIRRRAERGVRQDKIRLAGLAGVVQLLNRPHYSLYEWQCSCC
jgi:hypothetical protein